MVLSTTAVLYSASVFASSYITNFYLFLLLYCLLFGLLIGIVFMIPLLECNKYFPGMKIYVNGCILAGTGMGSLIFSLFSYNFLNPEKLRPLIGYYAGSPELEAIAAQVPTLIRWLSLFYFILSFLGIALMSPVLMHNRKQENEKLALVREGPSQEINTNQNI